jgi:hypothetical protein
LTGWNVEAKCRRQGGDREHQSDDSFHLDSPIFGWIFRRRNYWRIETNQLVDKEDRLLPSISSKSARTDDGDCSRDRDTTRRAHAVGGQSPMLALSLREDFGKRRALFLECDQAPDIAFH